MKGGTEAVVIWPSRMSLSRQIPCWQPGSGGISGGALEVYPAFVPPSSDESMQPSTRRESQTPKLQTVNKVNHRSPLPGTGREFSTATKPGGPETKGSSPGPRKYLFTPGFRLVGAVLAVRRSVPSSNPFTPAPVDHLA